MLTKLVDGVAVQMGPVEEAEFLAQQEADSGRTLVPQQISDRQFFQQLAVDGIITEEQALASNAAVIPAPLLAIIEQMPADQQFDAKMKVSGATTFYRDDPLTIGIGTAYGMTSEQIDEFFTAAAALV
jgi:phosphohistidine swiveling domain-containing protein